MRSLLRRASNGTAVLGFRSGEEQALVQLRPQRQGSTLDALRGELDIALFLKHHVGIQEGPTLCAQKLAADLEADRQGDHELSNEDLLVYVSGRAAKEAQRAALRRPGPHRRPVRPSGMDKRDGQV